MRGMRSILSLLGTILGALMAAAKRASSHNLLLYSADSADFLTLTLGVPSRSLVMNGKVEERCR